jgi:hypothetical protein
MMLRVAHDCCPEGLRSDVVCVVASRHGSISTTAKLLEEIAAERPLSPARFSHSVHNTQAGLFSIWARNVHGSSSLASGEESFAHGFLESVAQLQRSRARAALLLCGDEQLPESMAELEPRPCGSHAVALLLDTAPEGERLGFALESTSAPVDERAARPDALEFLRWWLSDEPFLRRVHGSRAWVWSRA